MKPLHIISWFALPNMKHVGDLFNILIIFIICLIEGRSQDCNHDTIPPELICKQYYQFEPSSCGMTEFYALELVESVWDNCSAVSVSFDREGKKRWIYQIELWDSLIQNGITIFARDTSGNISECTSKIEFVHTSKINCNLITGIPDELDKLQFKIKTSDQSYHNTQILKQSSSSVVLQTTTKDNVSIESINIELVTKPLSNQYIRTSDIIYILRNIIGLRNYNSPVNFLCSDADCNGEVNLLDVYHLEKYLLGTPIDSCVGKLYASFIDSSGKILGNEIPYHINSAQVPTVAYVMIGDVNTYFPDSLQGVINPVTNFNEEPLSWNVNQLHCTQNIQYTVDFKLNDSVYLFGLQGNLAFDPDLIQIEKFNTNYSPNNYKINNADILFDWINKFNPIFVNDYPTLSITFTAKKDFLLSDAFNTQQHSISNFAITNKGVVRPIEMAFTTLSSNKDAINHICILNIINNTSNHTTRIEANNLHCTEAELSVYSVTGNVVHQQKLIVNNGYANATFNIIQAGIYYAMIQIPGSKPLVESFVIIR